MRRDQPGTYQLQAAINAVHTDAATAEQTDWPQILTLYDQLLAVAPTPVVALNRAIAVGEVHGPAAALTLVEELALDTYHPFHATRADLLQRLGRLPARRRTRDHRRRTRLPPARRPIHPLNQHTRSTRARESSRSITECLRGAALTAAYGLQISAHCGPHLHAHVACATPNLRHLEWFHDHVRIESLFFDGALDPAGGTVRPDPTAPGLGLTLRNADIERYRAG